MSNCNACYTPCNIGVTRRKGELLTRKLTFWTKKNPLVDVPTNGLLLCGCLLGVFFDVRFTFADTLGCVLQCLTNVYGTHFDHADHEYLSQ